MDEEALLDVTRLTADGVKFFAHDPVMAMVSYSNFGSKADPECLRVHNVVDRMHRLNPDLPIDGEMEMSYALNVEARDKMFPFNKLQGKEVNTFVFPNLSSANSAYRLMLEMGVGESIGPIQMGLRKPVHFINVDAEVRDIINLVAIAGIDAAVLDLKN